MTIEALAARLQALRALAACAAAATVLLFLVTSF
jgi:hypothetical protein